MKHWFALLIAAPLIVHAQTPSPATLTADQVDSIMRQLEQLEGQITKNRADAFSTALNRFKAASTSEKAAVDFYISCYKLTNIDRKNLKQADFQAWEDRSQGMLQDPNFASGLRHQLEFLTLSLQAQDSEDTASLVSGLQNYISKVITSIQSLTKHSASGALETRDNNNRQNRPGGGGQRGNQGPGGQLVALLRNNIRSTEFTKAFQLENYFTKKEWEYEPLNIAGIYDKVILPYYLKEKPSEIGAQWDAHINAELSVRKALQSETEFQVYYKETFPQLQWSKAQYLLLNKIDPINALADMLKIVRENPTHAKAAEWLRELKEKVNATQPPSPSASISATAENQAPGTGEGK